MLSPLMLSSIKLGFSDDPNNEQLTVMPPTISLPLLDLSGTSTKNTTSSVSLESFFTSQSRVIKLYNLPQYDPVAFISHAFNAKNLPLPLTMWTSAEESEGAVFATFSSHQEACLVLSTHTPQLSMTHALELTLLPFSKLSRFDFASQNSAPQSSAISGDFMPLSSNPPNSSTIFRPMDWLCPSRQCGAHNFARNLSCIGCGCPQSSSPRHQSAPAALMPSPRFGGFGQPSPPYSSGPSSPAYTQQNQHNSNKSPGAHPLLTPSGRAFAQAGRVQNISSDPLALCVMFWPGNEPLPAQGQIRPSGHSTSPQPPILNTGNRGPIEHQPGDWICGTCNYLNWRRRKVCQTCFPYAEGNGDTVAAAVQAEHIALLSSLAQETTQTNSNTFIYQQSPQQRRQPILRSHSLTPPSTQRHFTDVSPPYPQSHEQRRHGLSVHRSQSHLDIGAQYAQPIYQTSGLRSLRSSALPTPSFDGQTMHAPAPSMLPSFLHDMVNVEESSPNLSPTSTYSGEFSSLDEDYDDVPSEMSRGRELSGFSLERQLSGLSLRSLSHKSSSNSLSASSHNSSLMKPISRPSSCLPSPVGSIWSMGVEELGRGSSFPMSRKSSHESFGRVLA